MDTSWYTTGRFFVERVVVLTQHLSSGAGFSQTLLGRSVFQRRRCRILSSAADITLSEVAAHTCVRGGGDDFDVEGGRCCIQVGSDCLLQDLLHYSTSPKGPGTQ